jgi:hypothetical protein
MTNGDQIPRLTPQTRLNQGEFLREAAQGVAPMAGQQESAAGEWRGHEHGHGTANKRPSTVTRHPSP